MKLKSNKVKYRLALGIGIAALILGIASSQTLKIRGEEVTTPKETNNQKQIKENRKKCKMLNQ